MNNVLTTLFVLLLIGLEVQAQPMQNECYMCASIKAFGEVVLKDTCSPGKFDPNSFVVTKVACPGAGKCYTVYAKAGGFETFTRACTSTPLPNIPAGSLACGQNGISCCDGNLCNGANVTAENRCYQCSYVDKMEVDNCSPANFDPDALLVEKLSCPGGQCYTWGTVVDGAQTSFIRSCTAHTMDGVLCGANGTVNCCEGDLCNGGPKSVSGSTSIVTGMTSMVTSLCVSFIVVIVAFI